RTRDECSRVSLQVGSGDRHIRACERGLCADAGRQVIEVFLWNQLFANGYAVRAGGSVAQQNWKRGRSAAFVLLSFRSAYCEVHGACRKPGPRGCDAYSAVPGGICVYYAAAGIEAEGQACLMRTTTLRERATRIATFLIVVRAGGVSGSSESATGAPVCRR